MTESDSSINLDNLGDIYNFLLGKDEKDLLSSLTPDSLETCLKIAQFYAGESQDKTVLAAVAKNTLPEFIQKHSIKEKSEEARLKENRPRHKKALERLKANRLHHKIALKRPMSFIKSYILYSDIE